MGRMGRGGKGWRPEQEGVYIKSRKGQYWWVTNIARLLFATAMCGVLPAAYDSIPEVCGYVYFWIGVHSVVKWNASAIQAA